MSKNIDNVYIKRRLFNIYYSNLEFSNKDDVNKRVMAIKRELSETDSEYDREKLNERIAKLAGGVAVIKVGAPTETELKNKKLRKKLKV